MRKLILLYMLVPNLCVAQQIGNGLINIYKSVGMVSFLPTPTVRNYGTGTIVYRKYGEDSFAFFLVTCKHVLPIKSQSDFVYFDIANELSTSKFSTIKIWVYDSLGNYTPEVKIDPDSNDVAVLNLTWILSFPQYKEVRGNAMPYEMLMSKDSIKVNDINVGDDVYFIGYPSGWYDKRNISPLVRSGIISSPPEEDFYLNDMVRIGHFNKFHEILPKKLNGFLIDANTTWGSSGSFVFLKPKFVRINKGLLEYNAQGGESLILGVLTYSFLDPQSIADPIKLNLGGVISASAIQKTINLFYR